MIKKIVFVCTANCCRSPIAEGVLKKLLTDNKINNFEVTSCGVFDFSGYPASGNSVKVCEENGVDISGHVSRYLDDGIVMSSDLLLCMELEHKNFILDRYPYLRDKVFTLREYTKDSKKIFDINIEDPVGEGIDVFRDAFQKIRMEIERIFPFLIKND